VIKENLGNFLLSRLELQDLGDQAPINQLRVKSVLQHGDRAFKENKQAKEAQNINQPT
jgi:hypothetical protein